MATKVLLPKFGQTVETSEIVQWTKKEGDAVKKGDILCEIATDKSSLEVESQYEGTLLRILLPPGKTAPVNCVMALIGTPGEAIPEALIQEALASQSASAAPAAEAAPAPAPAPAPVAVAPAPAPVVPKPAPVAAPTPAKPTPAAAAARPDSRIFISPRARKLAEHQHVPYAVLAGSGDGGRIVEDDVRGYLRAIGPATPAAKVAAATKGIDLRQVTGSGPGGRIVVEDLVQVALAHAAANGGAKKKAPKPAAGALVAKLEKPSPMRRAIAANMLASASTIPAFQLEVTVDAASLIARRETDKAAGHKISYGDYLARAVGLAIRRFPAFAATWTEQGLQYHDGAHVGFAVAVPGGLVVPVVHHCDSRSPAEIAAQSAALVDKARTGKLAPADYSGAVFTLSNLGAFPVDRFVAIVPPGQSGIIAIGRIRDEVAVKSANGALSFSAVKVMSLTLSADHRYIDGADGAAFMTELKSLLEDAATL